MTKHQPNATNGRKGGNTTLERYGVEHFQRMAAIAVQKLGREHYQRIGRMGGEAYNRKYVAGGLSGPI